MQLSADLIRRLDTDRRNPRQNDPVSTSVKLTTLLSGPVRLGHYLSVHGDAGRKGVQAIQTYMKEKR